MTGSILTPQQRIDIERSGRVFPYMASVMVALDCSTREKSASPPKLTRRLAP